MINREKECNAVVEQIIDILLFYFNEYPNELDEWGESFKKAFCTITDTIIKEIKNNT